MFPFRSQRLLSAQTKPQRSPAVLAIALLTGAALTGWFAVTPTASATTRAQRAANEPPGQWQLTGSPATGHANWWNTGFAQLPDGRVLAISGLNSPDALTSTAEIYDPGTGQWAAAGTLNDARYAFGTPSVLPNGDVLVAGGHDINVNDYATAELYDPATNQWSFTGNLNTARRYPVQVELTNGEVLVATGSAGPPTCTRYLNSAELYNPATGQWTYTGSTLVPRESANAILLADGDVLLAGGYNGGGSACTDTDPVDTEIYDPSTGQWSFAGNLPHGWQGGATVLLPDGRVLMVDGNETGSPPFAEAVIFNPATNQWTEAASPILPRTGAAATLLSDGDVLVSQGGQTQSEIYDPSANTWSLDAATLDTNGGGHTFLMPDGQVLLAGGRNSTGAASTTVELYTPAGVAPQTIDFTGPGSGTYGGSTTLTATGGGSGNPVVFSVDTSSTTGACAVSGTNGATVNYTGTGSCVIDANQLGGNGYSPAPQVQQTIPISPALLTITASSATMTYGGTPPTITANYAGFVAGDGPSSLTTQPTCSTTATSASPLGSFQPATCSEAADPNYQISYTPAEVTVTLGNYVSMGDSYSSGEGNGDYILNGNTDQPTDRCHRSTESYPAFLVNADPLSLADRPTYAACSGAETRDFLNSNHLYPVEQAQINNQWLNKATNVVTFTIGGNDVGFASVLESCAEASLGPIQLKGYGCSTHKALIAQVNKRIAALQGLASAKTPDGSSIISIQTLLQAIHRQAPNAAIFVAGYPHLFGPSTTNFQVDKSAPSKYSCVVGSPLFTNVTIDYTDAQWINTETNNLDNAIAAAATIAQAQGIPVTYISSAPNLFTTHSLCDSGTPWFHPLNGTVGQTRGKFHFIPDPGSFHPTQSGQQNGYETAFSGEQGS